MLTDELENDSKLAWQPSPGAQGYQVLWRDTTDPDFSEQHATGTRETSIDIDQSKDNLVFAVRAVDGKGHHSLLVVPEPLRQRSSPGS